MDCESFIDQRFRDFGRESGATLELFLFAAEPEVLGHGCDGRREERKNTWRSDSKNQLDEISTWEKPRDRVENPSDSSRPQIFSFFPSRHSAQRK